MLNSRTTIALVLLSACKHAPELAPAAQDSGWDVILRVFAEERTRDKVLPLSQDLPAGKTYKVVAQLNRNAALYIGQQMESGQFSIVETQQGQGGGSLTALVKPEPGRTRLCVLISTKTTDWMGAGCKEASLLHPDDECPDKGNGPPKGNSSSQGVDSKNKGGCPQPMFRGRMKDGALLVVLPIEKAG